MVGHGTKVSEGGQKVFMILNSDRVLLVGWIVGKIFAVSEWERNGYGPYGDGRCGVC